MSTSLASLPNDAHPTAVPAQNTKLNSEPQLGLNRELVNAVVGSLGNGAPLPTRDIPTAASRMAVDEQVQPNHVTVDDDYIARLSAAGQPASDREMVKPPEAHDIYLLPAVAAFTALVLMIPSTSVLLKQWTPKKIWNSDGTGTMVYHVLRAATVGAAVWAVNEYA